MIERILIVGLGSIGKRHLRFARELLPHAKIAVLRHKVESVIAEYADHSFSTMDEALAFAPQIAVIANPATFHLSVAMPLAQAGVHLLIEKPLSASTEGVTALLDACHKTNALLATGYNLRFLPSLQEFKSILDKNVIGTIWSVRSEIGQYLPSWRPGTDYRLGVSAQHELGGGVLLELSHELDYLRWIFGEVNWVQASLTKQSDLEINVEDTAHLIMGFSAKKDGNLLIATVNMDFIRQDTTRICTAIGKQGSLRWNGIAGTVEFLSSGSQDWQEVYRHQATRDESYFAEWKNFVLCVEQQTEPYVSGEDGLKVLHMIEAVRQAATTGSRVHVVSVPKFRE
jgi:predicted dehydrogenase